MNYLSNQDENPPDIERMPDCWREVTKREASNQRKSQEWNVDAESVRQTFRAELNQDLGKEVLQLLSERGINIKEAADHSPSKALELLNLNYVKEVIPKDRYKQASKTLKRYILFEKNIWKAKS